MVPPGHSHGLERKVFFLVVYEPGRALRDVVEAEGEEDEEDAGDEAQPVPGEGATHDVAADDAQGGHHLRGAFQLPEYQVTSMVGGQDGSLPHNYHHK